MTVLHFISDPDKNSLSHIFLKEMQKGGDTTLAAHIMTVFPADDLADGGKASVYQISPFRWLSIDGRRQFAKVVASVNPDIIHIHSFWSTASWLVFRWAREKRIPVVVSTYKKLMKWNFQYHYATSRLPRYLSFQREMLKGASAVHAVTTQEMKMLMTVSWHPGINAGKALNDKIALVTFADKFGGSADAGTEAVPDYGRLANEMRRLYRKVADSNPFMLMTDEDRRMENDLLSLGAPLMANMPLQEIFTETDCLSERVVKMEVENWRRIQLHSADQGILQAVTRAYLQLNPEGTLLKTEDVDRFGANRELPFLETMHAKGKVARMKQLANDYAHYDVERKLCIMLVNVRYLLKNDILTRRNLADICLVFRYEEYNDYVLENMLNEIGMWKFASRILYILHRYMNLEEGFIPFRMTNDRNTKSIIRKLFKSNMQ